MRQEEKERQEGRRVGFTLKWKEHFEDLLRLYKSVHEHWISCKGEEVQAQEVQVLSANFANFYGTFLCPFRQVLFLCADFLPGTVVQARAPAPEARRSSKKRKEETMDRWVSLV